MRAVVNTDIASMRDEARLNISLSDEVLYGMMVDILEEAGNGYYKVRTDYQYEGYLLGAELLMNKSLVEQWEKLSYKRIYQSCADILTEPRVQGLLLKCLPRGSVVHEIGPVEGKDGWVEILLCDGTKGYTKEKYVGTFHQEASSQWENKFRSNLVNTAKTYLGTQYRWGGKTPFGIDCSGLTFMSYLMNGVTIYRDAHIKEGFPIHEIEFEDKKPGDLLFFKGHVALYIGENQYIHATGKTGSDGVVINSFNPKAKDYREDLIELLYATGSIF